MDNVRTKEVFINFVAGYTFNYFSLLLAEFSKGKSTFGATVRPSERALLLSRPKRANAGELYRTQQAAALEDQKIIHTMAVTREGQCAYLSACLSEPTFAVRGAHLYHDLYVAVIKGLLPDAQAMMKKETWEQRPRYTFAMSLCTWRRHM